MVTRVPFNPDRFYSRQMILPELGSEGQEKLRRSEVVIVGLGGLGSASALYLAMAGVGHIRLVDQDTVELHNLHRQVLYGLDDLRYPKVEAAAQRIQQMNPEIKVESIPENVKEDNVEEIIHDVNCVVDGLDNIRTRYLLNRACVKHKIPYIFGAAIGIEGNLSVFTPPETPCLPRSRQKIRNSMLLQRRKTHNKSDCNACIILGMGICDLGVWGACLSPSRERSLL